METPSDLRTTATICHEEYPSANCENANFLTEGVFGQPQAGVPRDTALHSVMTGASSTNSRASSLLNNEGPSSADESNDQTLNITARRGNPQYAFKVQQVAQALKIKALGVRAKATF
ncbi:hypothetical protein T265_06309 [Opisthorchis viverrini]|uniref:Uncharacterized protein n=1 Tax=Opisthorchis viverrini TaxID=6198 RepID=A0A074ZSU4_OPIVI|nr:hypothetical protein T265_06309 [Opisthorchis viverrini]KER26455.1 hypothetical protein T265_06309 [Opisthorchis viverrini]